MRLFANMGKVFILVFILSMVGGRFIIGEEAWAPSGDSFWKDRSDMVCKNVRKDGRTCSVRNLEEGDKFSYTDAFWNCTLRTTFVGARDSRPGRSARLYVKRSMFQQCLNFFSILFAKPGAPLIWGLTIVGGIIATIFGQQNRESSARAGIDIVCAKCDQYLGTANSFNSPCPRCGSNRYQRE